MRGLIELLLTIVALPSLVYGLGKEDRQLLSKWPSGDADIYGVQIWFVPSNDPTSQLLGEALVSAFSAGQSINGVTFASRTIGYTQGLVASRGFVLYNTNTDAIVEFLVTGDKFSPDSGPLQHKSRTANGDRRIGIQRA